MPFDNSKKEDFFSKSKTDYPSDEERERTYKIIKRFDIKNREELTQFYVKSGVFYSHVFLRIL